MRELLPITITSIILAWLSQHVNTRPLTEDGKFRKDWIIFSIMAIYMILFAGLRTRYNDTYNYIHMYESLNINKPVDWKIGNNPGFYVFMRLFKAAGISSQSFLLLFAIITVSIFLWFVRKYSTNLWLSVFLLFTTGCYIFTLAAVKQCISIALGLLAIDRYLNGKKALFVLYILVGMLFHPYILMFFVVPLLNFQPWNNKTWIMLAFFFTAGLALQPLMGTVISITDVLGEGFDVAEFTGEGVHPFRLAVATVPLVLSFITRRVIQAENNREQDLMVNLSMLNATVMFVGLFGTANYFARLANYFLIFQCISLPWLLSQFEQRTKRYLTFFAIVGFVLYFVYENAINRQFDSKYASVSLIDYIESLL